MLLFFFLSITKVKHIFKMYRHAYFSIKKKKKRYLPKSDYKISKNFLKAFNHAESSTDKNSSILSRIKVTPEEITQTSVNAHVVSRIRTRAYAWEAENRTTAP